MSSGRMRRLGEVCTAYQGEVNETTDGKKGSISESPKEGPLILRGSNVCLYALREASQVEAHYLRQKKYLQGKRLGTKAWQHRQRRVGFQRNSPQNNFRRLIACYIPVDQFCCDTVSYFPEEESQLPLNVLLALFNSKLLDWFFRLGSTNSKVNDYQVKVLPVPVFVAGASKEQDLSPAFRKAIEQNKLDEALVCLDSHLAQPPFPSGVVATLTHLVEKIMRIEDQRGEIARTERSALAPEAQPYQDLIDRILYRMAGLTDAEAEGLELRLAEML